MPTLSEYQKLANDDVTAGVFDNIITASELAPFLQFSSSVGTPWSTTGRIRWEPLLLIK